MWSQRHSSGKPITHERVELHLPTSTTATDLQVLQLSRQKTSTQPKYKYFPSLGDKLTRAVLPGPAPALESTNSA